MSDITGQKNIGFRKLLIESLPEMWGYQIAVSFMLAIPATILIRLINSLAGMGDGALTSANFRSALSWRVPLILLLGFFLIFSYVVIEILSHIQFADDILNGYSRSTLQRIRSGMISIRHFASFRGILVLLFIFLAVPLCGIGFSIRLSSRFKIPNFIMDVVISTPLYLIIYIAILLLLLWTAYTSMFIIHAMVIDKMTVRKARETSRAIIKKHGRSVLWALLKLTMVIGIVVVLSELLLIVLPELWLMHLAKDLPRGYFLDITAKSNPFDLNGLEQSIVRYRFLCALFIVMGTYLVSVVGMLCGSYFMLRFTELYYRFTDRAHSVFLSRPKKSGYFRHLALSFAILLITVVGSGFLSLYYNQFFYREKKVDIIAHRAGGFAAVENSLEGLLIAIEKGVYGSEIDVQRTKDKKYIINHDTTFKRLAGVNRAAKDMTLSEIENLKIRDKNFGKAVTTVPTLDKMLAASGSKIKLFVELKGVVDEAMADEIVSMIREYGTEKDIAMISLDYRIIDYVEKTYPELDTGVLFFAGLGDVTKLNCDMLIMEEALAGAERIEAVQSAGKKAIVWTVNTEDSMRKFLDSNVDAIITDDMNLAEQVQADLDRRSDLEVIRDQFGDIWEY